ncbi:hypothetical protein Y1Q_0024488 [Alligator mississippiensis]|uniref:Uncharacterized protein n=1 Tax=Alligator mississippiensis TaxID=8496 RepID=A0A151NB63_ALLMI|nr:hypothetical protein Y1Q_0024488 [Alligator mississippiensis]
MLCVIGDSLGKVTWWHTSLQIHCTSLVVHGSKWKEKHKDQQRTTSSSTQYPVQLQQSDMYAVVARRPYNAGYD